MLIYTMTVSADGFVEDRDGGIDWSAPSDELFEFHLDRVRGLGGHLIGRRLYETMLVWETDPSLRSSSAFTEFADAWTDLPKVVFSRSPVEVRGNARMATAPLDDEIRRMLASTDRDVEIGGADLAGQAFGLGLVDDIRVFRAPVVLGGGTSFFPPSDTMTRLALVETRTFEPDIVFEHYHVVHTAAAN
ncbi:dihydrofolate reductase [Planctomonas sp. JC2975]|uniref:dihydrofolate reductase family protein n=1 Tax=Planctomonas sp. JC2975 TaxID=2729626 RepID=UPI00147302E4|nr:dihydrofolate reductase family protein [Planctomonas sp. JC2975]NNC13815.1 dihydrofolate reductase [Planctomonas sp. JC2975]